jgi:hypothetical protein
VKRSIGVIAATIGLVCTGAASAQAVSYDRSGTGGSSSCSTKLTSRSAAAITNAHDKFHTNYHKVTVDSSVNNADYWACNAAGSPLAIKSIRGTNRYAFTGIRVSDCSGGFPAGFNCTITGGSSVYSDASASVSKGRSHLDFDQFGVVASWTSGVFSHYKHSATAVYTGYNGSTVTTTSTVDKAI